MAISRNCKPVHVGLAHYRIDFFAAELKAFLEKHGENCHVKISRAKTSKTQKQLAFIHALIKPLAGSPCHSYKFGTLKEFKELLKCDFGISNKFEINGEKYIHIKSLGDYSRYELSDFIDNVVNFCNVCGAYPEHKKIVEIIDGAMKDKLNT